MSSKDYKKFAVVCFPKENNRYAVVPSLWLTTKKDNILCRWPTPTTKNVSQLVKTADSKPLADWKQHPVEFVKGYDDFDKAEKKSKSLRKSKGLEIPDTSESEVNLTSKAPKPIAPTTYLHEEESQPEIIDQESADPPDGIVFVQDSQQFAVVSTVSLENLQTELREFQAVVVENQEKLIDQVNQLTKFVKLSLSQSTVLTGRGHDYPSLPLKSVDELNSCEETIQDERQYQLLVNELSRCGGQSVSKAVYNTLRGLINPDLRKEVRITDSSGKVAFGGLKLSSAVRSAVQVTFKGKKASDTKLNVCIGRHFRNCKSDNGDAKKNSKPKNSAPSKPKTQKNSPDDADPTSNSDSDSENSA